MEDDLDDLSRRLVAGGDAEAMAPAIERVAEGARPDQLVAFAASIAVRGTGSDPTGDHVRTLVLDSIERALALADSLPAVGALLRVLAVPRRGPRPKEIDQTRTRRAGSLLAGAHREELFGGALSRYGKDPTSRELFACWAHELVVRGHDLSGHGAVRALAAQLREAQHPLGGLPFAPIDLELGLRAWVPRFGEGAVSVPLTRPPSSRPAAPLRLAARSDDRPFVVVPAAPDVDREERMREAVRGWVEGGSGRARVRVFDLQRPVLEGDLPPVLDAIAAGGFEPLLGAPEIRVIEPERALSVLFFAAANGGAWGGAMFGAYGRLFAWRSLSALAGAPAVAPPPALPAIARRRLWAEVKPAAPWFDGAAFDLLLVSVASGDGGREAASVAILAATDSD